MFHFIMNRISLEFPNGYRVVPAATDTGLLAGMVTHIPANPWKRVVPTD
jgi:hypothetical protein